MSTWPRLTAVHCVALQLHQLLRLSLLLSIAAHCKCVLTNLQDSDTNSWAIKNRHTCMHTHPHTDMKVLQVHFLCCPTKCAKNVKFSVRATQWLLNMNHVNLLRLWHILTVTSDFRKTVKANSSLHKPVGNVIVSTLATQCLTTSHH